MKGVVADGVSSFKGIPFAAPPIADFRWKAPQPLKAWKGVLKPLLRACLHADYRKHCQTFGGAGKSQRGLPLLNIWTAAKNEGEKRPVMVWIYGGGFQAA